MKVRAGRRRLAFGDDATAAPPPAVDTSVIGKLTGALGVGDSDPVTTLKAELNRFADPAAGKFAVFPAPLPLSPVLDSDTAGRAMALVNLRLLFATVPTAATPDFQHVLDDANASISDPVGWANRNLPLLISLITGIADTNNLPAADLGGLLTPRNMMIAAGAVLLLYAFTHTGKSRSTKPSTKRRSRR